MRKSLLMVERWGVRYPLQPELRRTSRKDFGVGEAGKKYFDNPLFNYSILES